MNQKYQSSAPTLPIEAITLLPHRPPMLFVDSLTERFDDEARGLAVMPGSGICCDEGKIFPEYFIEVIAQTMAMAHGYDALVAGHPMRDGLLVAIDRFSFLHTAASGTRLNVHVKKTMEFGAVKILHGEIYDGETLLVEGDLKVWEAPGEIQHD
jgi:predicted hotdog family 3-hydroxylacyl-ACP dehydratase